MGFSLHSVEIKAGMEIVVGHKHHLEAVYCISGKMDVETLADGKKYKIKAETAYAMGDPLSKELKRNRFAFFHQMVCNVLKLSKYATIKLDIKGLKFFLYHWG